MTERVQNVSNSAGHVTKLIAPTTTTRSGARSLTFASIVSFHGRVKPKQSYVHGCRTATIETPCLMCVLPKGFHPPQPHKRSTQFQAVSILRKAVSFVQQDRTTRPTAAHPKAPLPSPPLPFVFDTKTACAYILQAHQDPSNRDSNEMDSSAKA
eukprot:g5862.t1